jgi:glycosyltransferase involved in cell wall biosynthesis
MTYNRSYIIVAECFGHGLGGDGKLALLMARELNAMGYKVYVFCLHVTEDDVELCRSRGINVELGKWRYGCRWKLPEWRLSRQVINAARQRQDAIILKLGITYLTRLLLNSPVDFRLVISETTQASPDNKFVDKRALELLGRCMAITAPSKTVEHNVRKVYNYKGTILRLPHWVDPDDLGVADYPQLIEKIETDFLYLGRLDPEKGLFELLKAFGELVIKYPRSSLTVCGLGSSLPYKKVAMEVGCEDQVTFTSERNPRKVGELIQKCKWMILPSHHEGYPLSPLEAFACGRPAILTKAGSIPEMCRDSLAAIMIPPGDVEILHAAMNQALKEHQGEYIERCIAAKHLFSMLSGPESVRKHLGHLMERLQENQF